MRTAFLAPRSKAKARNKDAEDDFVVVDSPEAGMTSLVLHVRAASALRESQGLIELLNETLRDRGFDATVLAASGADLAAGAASLAGAVKAAELEENRAASQRAEMRGEARLVAWIQDGTLIEGSKLAEAWAVKRQTLDAARRRGELFSLWVKGKHWYPAELLKFERPALAAVTRKLGDVDSSSKLLFLLRSQGALGGKTPADAIADGRLGDVLRLAEHWGHD